MKNVSSLRNIVFNEAAKTLDSLKTEVRPELKSKIDLKKPDSEIDTAKRFLDTYEEFSKFKKISDELQITNPRLYVILIKNFIPDFFKLSKENSDLFKDKLLSSLEDFFPVKHTKLQEDKLIDIEASVFSALQSSDESPDRDLDLNKLKILRANSLLKIKGITKYPRLLSLAVNIATEAFLSILMRCLKKMKNYF